MAFSQRMVTLAAVVAIPLGIAATSYTLTDTPEAPMVPPEVELGTTTPRPAGSTGSSAEPSRTPGPSTGAGTSAGPGRTPTGVPVPSATQQRAPSGTPPAPRTMPTDTVVPGPPATAGDDDDDDLGDDAGDEN
ncbi:hypothetical protein [Streptomyces sp. CB03238]|uniref:hypothetical protein n=1 Tax=Streptomyces sp. CB03238 TaxID=1907777 RepID=UPI000A10432A|nr:hypothetical protein [Streptomyces sp. CB03238]ORT60276.1 hypothetical protein BKD26_07750 [Streptomyces sp. CB03238]